MVILFSGDFKNIPGGQFREGAGIYFSSALPYDSGSGNAGMVRPRKRDHLPPVPDIIISF